MLIKIKFAEKSQKNEVLAFFFKNISKENDWIINEEFLCPFGISAAIARKQVIVMDYDNEIIWWLRFYPRKKDNIVSCFKWKVSIKMIDRKNVEV